MQANGRHLLGLINDVLDLSKIEAGQLTLALQDYAVVQIVQTVISGTESLARAKGLALVAKVQENIPYGRGDERRIAQVLLNLVGNAIKFTDQGSVEIEARAAGGFFDIAVHDTGPGISVGGPAADLRGVSAGRQQLDAQEGRHRTWTCNLEAAHRDARRDADRGIGSRRGLDVPGADPHARRGTDGGGMTKRILMVEDTEDNRQIVRDLMESVGYVLLEAHDGAAGIQMAGEHKPDLILMDIQLPVLDGYEATGGSRAILPSGTSRSSP